MEIRNGIGCQVALLTIQRGGVDDHKLEAPRTHGIVEGWRMRVVDPPLPEGVSKAEQPLQGSVLLCFS